MSDGPLFDFLALENNHDGCWLVRLFLLLSNHLYSVVLYHYKHHLLHSLC